VGEVDALVAGAACGSESLHAVPRVSATTRRGAAKVLGRKVLTGAIAGGA
jgi:hypothetical protein